MADDRRVALVTGGAKRVGRAILEKLAAEGFAVAFTFHRSGGEAQSLAENLDAIAIEADLTDPEIASQRIFDAFLKRHQRLDLLVNSASIYKSARLRDTDMQLMRQVAAVHVQSPLLICKHFESMLRASRGHIVNM